MSEEWVQINFKKHYYAFYKKLIDSEFGIYHDVPNGSRTNKASISSLKIKNFGPRIKYQQYGLPACVFYSLANACAFIGENFAATKLFDVFQHNLIDESYIPKFSEATFVMRNRFHIKPQKKIRFNIDLLNFFNSSLIINNREHNVIYHIQLNNNHVITTCNEWIFDAEFEYALPRNDTNLRLSAEATDGMSSDDLLKKVYKYTLVKKLIKRKNKHQWK